MLHWKNVALLGLLVSTIGGLYLWRNASRTAAIAAQNEIAARDTTRLVLVDKAEQAAIYARVIRQMGVQLDKTTRRALKAEGNAKPRARTGIVVQASPVRRDTTHVLVPQANGPWLADSLQLQGPPITGTVNVKIKPDSAIWRYDLRPDPITLGYTLACGDKGAVVAIKVPDWASVSIDSGAVDPEVCHKKSSKFLLGAGLGAAAAAVLTTLLLGVQ